MTIGILATGDEIVHGDTLNTNSRDMAQVLSSEGFPLGLQVSCSDKKTDIVNCLQFLVQYHDIIIITGGLGPTTDDLTRFALAAFTQEPLVQREEALEHIYKRTAEAKLPMNEGNLQQALFPAQALILPNPRGSAVGCCHYWQDKAFILLPGPPKECLPMFHQDVLPLLQKTQKSNKQILKWRIFGRAESEIGQVLEEALAKVECQTGYRLETPYIEFKVRCKPALANTIKEIVDPILAPHIISPVAYRASDLLRERLKTLKEPLTVIDEVTGGLLESLLLCPETHQTITFTGLAKTKHWFHLKGLQDYWSQKPSCGTTEVFIQHQGGEEQHTIPYRSPMVVSYAAEWLSFRILQLINQLHEVIA